MLPEKPARRTCRIPDTSTLTDRLADWLAENLPPGSLLHVFAVDGAAWPGIRSKLDAARVDFVALERPARGELLVFATRPPVDPAPIDPDATPADRRRAALRSSYFTAPASMIAHMRPALIAAPAPPIASAGWSGGLA